MPQNLADYLPLLVLIAVALVIKVLLTTSTKKQFEYRMQDQLLTPAERSFLGVLASVISPNQHIIYKVRLADLITPAGGLRGSEWQRAFNRISSKHIDFVVCRSDDLSVFLTIELDDSSHQKKARVERDSFVEGALKSAGVPLLRVPAKKAYSPSELREKIALTVCTS